MTRNLIALLLALLAGCSTGPRVHVQPTPGTDYSKYRTYAIRPGNVVYPGATEAQRAEIERRIQDSVAAALEGRGLAPQPEGPDVIVTYTAGARHRDAGPAGATPRAAEGVDVRGPGGYDEPGAVRAREWPDAAADAEMRRYTEGSLVIDLLDGRSRRLVWRATADLELASDRGARTIGRVVSRAFARLPVSGPAPTPVEAAPAPAEMTAPLEPQSLPATEPSAVPASEPPVVPGAEEPLGTSTTDRSSE